MTDRRRLIIMRHAKAEPFGETDHSRRLTARGRSEASAAGHHLVATGALPDYAVVSSATRAASTWDRIAEVLRDETDADPVVGIDDAVFAGSAEVVLEALRAVPAGTRTLIIVGHNPTASYLCHQLDDGIGDPEALRGLLTGFPTAAFAVFEVKVTWSELGSESGRLVDFFAPA